MQQCGRADSILYYKDTGLTVPLVNVNVKKKIFTLQIETFYILSAEGTGGQFGLTSMSLLVYDPNAPLNLNVSLAKVNTYLH